MVMTRFTPTCVGNTRGAVIIRFHHPVHPHMRGEYRLNGLALEDSLGSPPHAWGILYFQQYYRVQQRFTPTCVGNTVDAVLYPSARAVHPHMRGEYRVAYQHRPATDGSPPHAWGIRWTSSSAWCWLSSISPVHPHMRGEYGTGSIVATSANGSPPHAWGILPRALE